MDHEIPSNPYIHHEIIMKPIQNICVAGMGCSKYIWIGSFIQQPDLCRAPGFIV